VNAYLAENNGINSLSVISSLRLEITKKTVGNNTKFQGDSIVITESDLLKVRRLLLQSQLRDDNCHR
jgi:hypothetical protein